MNVEGGIQIADLWAIVLRRVKVVACITLGVVLVAFWVAMALPNKYQSYATVLVTPQSVSPELVASGVPKSDLNNRLFLMTAQILSRGQLSAIIDKLELYEKEHLTMERVEIIALMRKAIRVAPVLDQLRAAQGKGSASDEINQFKISFTHRNAITAMQVVKRLSNDFIEEHIESRIKVSEKSVEFIDGELNRLSKRIRQVEGQEAVLKAENPGRLPSDVDPNHRRMERLLETLARAQQALAEANSDEAFYRSQITSAISAGGALTPAGRLQELDLFLADLAARGFTEKHPDILKVRMEIKELEDSIARDEAALADSDEGALSIPQQGLEAERRRAALRITATEDEIDRINDSLDEVTVMLAEAPAVAESLLGLQREYKHLFDSYQDFSDRQLEATVQAQLERRQLGEQFRVLEAAFVAPKPAFPNRPMILVLGLFAGLIAALGLGIVLESMDPSVHTARQLQLAVGIPVLAAIPQILLEADLAVLRRGRIKVAVATAAVMAFTGVGGVSNYVWVNGMPSSIAEFIEGKKAEVNQAGDPVEADGGADPLVDSGPTVEE